MSACAYLHLGLIITDVSPRPCGAGALRATSPIETMRIPARPSSLLAESFRAEKICAAHRSRLLTHLARDVPRAGSGMCARQDLQP